MYPAAIDMDLFNSQQQAVVALYFRKATTPTDEEKSQPLSTSFKEVSINNLGLLILDKSNKKATYFVPLSFLTFEDNFSFKISARTQHANINIEIEYNPLLLSILSTCIKACSSWDYSPLT